MEIALGLVGLVAVVCLVSAFAERFRLSAPLLLVGVGFIGSYLPFIPDVEFSPELVLVGMLPPLLYSAAIRTSLIDFRHNRRAIGLLSVGYVIFGTLAVGVVVRLVFGVDWASAFALGAVVAPPDAVATTAVARRIGMPRRLVDILEGESLVNDATALVCLRIAIVGATSFWQIAGDFLVAAVGGVAVGFVLAIGVIWLRKKVIRDVVIDTLLSFGTPFVAYVAAEEFHPIGGDAHASGVIAVVVAGLLIGHKSPVVQSGASRLSERINWATIQFVLENSVFLLIGLQVRSLVEAVEGDSLGVAKVWIGCGIILVAVLVLRPVWMFPATYIPRLIPAVRRTDPAPPWTYPAILSWAGMRGVVTLAAAFLLRDREHGEVLVLAAFVVVAGTLILQGSTLAWLVRALKVPGPDRREDLLQEAAVLQETAEAGLAELEKVKLPDDPDSILAALRQRLEQRRMAAWERLGRPESDGETPSQRFLRLRLAMLAAERQSVLDMRKQGHIPQHILNDVLEVLDVEEALVASWGDPYDEPERRGELTAPAAVVAAGCEHLADAPVTRPPNSSGVCLDCIREGTETVHLRMCLNCGNVGCCDSSEAKHADRHYADTGHPVMRSIEPGEAWRWCYLDNLLG